MPAPPKLTDAKVDSGSGGKALRGAGGVWFRAKRKSAVISEAGESCCCACVGGGFKAQGPSRTCNESKEEEEEEERCDFRGGRELRLRMGRAWGLGVAEM